MFEIFPSPVCTCFSCVVGYGDAEGLFGNVDGAGSFEDSFVCENGYEIAACRGTTDGEFIDVDVQMSNC